MGIKITSTDFLGKIIIELDDVDENICQSQLDKLYEDQLTPLAFSNMRSKSDEGQIVDMKQIQTIQKLFHATLNEYLISIFIPVHPTEPE